MLFSCLLSAGAADLAEFRAKQKGLLNLLYVLAALGVLTIVFGLFAVPRILPEGRRLYFFSGFYCGGGAGADRQRGLEHPAASPHAAGRNRPAPRFHRANRRAQRDDHQPRRPRGRPRALRPALRRGVLRRPLRPGPSSSSASPAPSPTACCSFCSGCTIAGSSE